MLALEVLNAWGIGGTGGGRLSDGQRSIGTFGRGREGLTLIVACIRAREAAVGRVNVDALITEVFGRAFGPSDKSGGATTGAIGRLERAVPIERGRVPDAEIREEIVGGAGARRAFRIIDEAASLPLTEPVSENLSWLVVRAGNDCAGLCGRATEVGGTVDGNRDGLIVRAFEGEKKVRDVRLRNLTHLAGVRRARLKNCDASGWKLVVTCSSSAALRLSDVVLADAAGPCSSALFFREASDGILFKSVVAQIRKQNTYLANSRSCALAYRSLPDAIELVPQPPSSDFDKF